MPVGERSSPVVDLQSAGCPTVLLVRGRATVADRPFICHSCTQWRRQGGKGGSFPPWVDVQKLCNICVLWLSWNFFVSHDKFIARPLIHRQYNRDWGTSYSRPPRDQYLTSPLLQNPGGAIGCMSQELERSSWRHHVCHIFTNIIFGENWMHWCTFYFNNPTRTLFCDCLCQMSIAIVDLAVLLLRPKVYNVMWCNAQGSATKL